LSCSYFLQPNATDNVALDLLETDLGEHVLAAFAGIFVVIVGLCLVALVSGFKKCECCRPCVTRCGNIKERYIKVLKTKSPPVAVANEEQVVQCRTGFIIIAFMCGIVALFSYREVHTKLKASNQFIDYPVTVCWIGFVQICQFCDTPYKQETYLSFLDPENKTNIITNLTCVDIACDLSSVNNTNSTIYRANQSYTGRLNPSTKQVFLTTNYPKGWFVAGLVFFGLMGISFLICCFGLHIFWFFYWCCCCCPKKLANATTYSPPPPKDDSLAPPMDDEVPRPSNPPAYEDETDPYAVRLYPTSPSVQQKTT